MYGVKIEITISVDRNMWEDVPGTEAEEDGIVGAPSKVLFKKKLDKKYQNNINAQKHLQETAHVCGKTLNKQSECQIFEPILQKSSKHIQLQGNSL